MTDAPLPGILGELEAVIGRPAVLRLVREHGGTEIYVPKRPGTDSPIVRAIGVAAAAELADAYGGEHLLIPLGHLVTQARLAAAIGRAVDAGLSAERIARQVGVHERTVRRHRRRRRGGSDLPDLFGR